MAIDYTRKRPTPPAAAPAAPPVPAANGSGLPSWYTPPEEDEAAAAPAPLPQAPRPSAPPTPSAYPAPTAAWPPPASAAGYPPPSAPANYPPPSGPPVYQPTASVPAPSRAGGVSLQKVSLTASAPQISLTKTGGSSGNIRVNLNWSQGAAAAPSGQKAGGFFKRLAAQAAGGSGGVDLDLGCLYELSDGSKGVVQALGNSFGSLDRAPWIKLDGDDRTGAVTSGENMSINLDQPGRFRRILIFAMIYEGAPNWAAVDGVVTLSPINGPQIEVRLDASEQAARICAVAQLINNNGDLVVQREVKYINGGQSVLDRQYGWGMNWSPGRK